VDNAWIADRLEAFAALLELADANPYTPRAYRRAAETIRSAGVPVAGLVQSGRVRELRGIGRGIESRLRELVETGEIAELAELERELSPELVGLGRYLGLSAARSLEIARALGVRTAGELREAAAGGRLQSVPGIGRKREAQLLDALAREGEPRPQRGLLLNRAWELVGGVADALGGEAAGDVRRWRDSCDHLAVVCAAPDPAPVLARFAALPQIVAVVEQAERRAVGVTVDGVPIELLAAEPERFGTALLRATGAPAYVAALEPLPDGADEASVFAALGVEWCPPELREGAFRAEPPALVEQAEIRGDLHCHTTWSDGRASVEEMGRAARERGYDYVAICDHTPAVGAVRGLSPDDVRRQAEEIAAANEVLAPFRVLRGIECDILPDGRLDLPDDVLAELDWVQASVHGGQRMPRREMTDRVEEALRNPYVRCLSHPTGRIIGRRPENALDLERVYTVAVEQDIAIEVNGLAPRLDLSGEHVRDAIRAGVRIVCSTDAHSTRGLENMELAVRTARRGWATTADILNTGPLASILRS
jgi:DNA polymerase (family X)